MPGKLDGLAIQLPMYYVQIMQLLNPDAQVAEHRQQRLLTIVIFRLGALSQLLVERAAIAIL